MDVTSLDSLVLAAQVSSVVKITESGDHESLIQNVLYILDEAMELEPKNEALEQERLYIKRRYMNYKRFAFEFVEAFDAAQIACFDSVMCSEFVDTAKFFISCIDALTDELGEALAITPAVLVSALGSVCDELTAALSDIKHQALSLMEQMQ